MSKTHPIHVASASSILIGLGFCLSVIGQYCTAMLTGPGATVIDAMRIPQVADTLHGAAPAFEASADVERTLFLGVFFVMLGLLFHLLVVLPRPAATHRRKKHRRNR